MRSALAIQSGDWRVVRVAEVTYGKVTHTKKYI
jgi:hypothetical protein